MERWKNGIMGRIGILACQGLSESQIRQIRKVARQLAAAKVIVRTADSR